jgi:cysteine-rich repeat protein
MRSVFVTFCALALFGCRGGEQPLPHDAGTELPFCGDGTVDANETCDDGNSVGNDGCAADCTLEFCGNGRQEGDEACDDQNSSNDDGCVQGCQLASCGDGFTFAGTEACDDGNGDDTDACLSDCRAAACGDGAVWLDHEACDDGNAEDGDTCLNTCERARCGDGVARTDRVEGEEGYEGCDDGNEVDEDACRTTCVAARCGDGVVRVDRFAGEPFFEACDDGNDNSDDGCLPNCVRAPRAVVCGPGRSCLIDARGDLWCAGDDEDGLAFGIAPGVRRQPRWRSPHFALPALRSVALGARHNCALSDAGEVLCWGSNSNGQVGVPGRVTHTAPATVFGGDMTGLSAFGSTTCAVSDVALHCWGLGSAGGLGAGEEMRLAEAPVRSAEFETPADLMLGGGRGCLRFADGSVRCFGNSEFGELPGFHRVLWVPTPVTELAGSEALVLGSEHGCVTRADTVHCFGGARVGQLGDGLPPADESRAVTAVSGDPLTGVATGSEHSCALRRSDGQVMCWGAGGAGQLGNGDRDDRNAPTAVDGVDEVFALSAGDRHTCLRTRAGGVWCTGDNEFGQLGSDRGERSEVPLPVWPR